MLVSGPAALLASLVTVFHAVLLWQRVLDLSLFRPVPAIRWLVTIALLVGLYRLHRRGVSLVRGRRALVFWLLVLLLHVCFWGPLADPSSSRRGWTDAGLLLALPAFTVVSGFFVPAIRRLLARTLSGVGLRDLPIVAAARVTQGYIVRAGFLPTLSCRPPPLISS